MLVPFGNSSSSILRLDLIRCNLLSSYSHMSDFSAISTRKLLSMWRLLPAKNCLKVFQIPNSGSGFVGRSPTSTKREVGWSSLSFVSPSYVVNQTSIWMYCITNAQTRPPFRSSGCIASPICNTSRTAE